METWEPPKEFDDYVLLGPLGSGQMGKVYLAEDTMLARQVAIKFIAAIEPDAAARQRFLIEARAAARIQHPNVVTIYRVGEYAEKPYLITEFVRGKTLEASPRPIDWRRGLGIGVDLARGLAAAHRRGVLHRDIKAANVILDEDGSAKLLDFGLAALAEEQGGPEGLVGTPDFMAPEIWRGRPATRRSDVYSLGAVLYQLLAGDPPFAHVAADDLQRVAAAEEPPPLARRARDIDPRLAAIIDRCLRRSEDERYPSGEELRDALEILAETADILPVPAGNPYRGLRSFDENHRALFFGRQAEVGVVLDLLRTEAFVVVTGDSGVGKSSLCRAGLLPPVRAGALGAARAWSSATVIPGQRPSAALATALEAVLGLAPGTILGWLDAEPGGVGRRVAAALGPSRGLLVHLDQLEELLLLGDPGDVPLVEQALLGLIEAGPGVRVLASLRADFLTRFVGLPILGEALSRHLYFLRPLDRERLREVIVGPAEATGVRFESEELVAELADAAARAGGGLPLLQFALAELWEKRDRESHEIRRATVDALGGVGGALAGHSDEVIGALPHAQRRAARHVLTALVSSAGTRARRSGAELGGQESEVSAALDVLVRGRLIVPYEGDDGSAYELAHEVLITGWGTLRDWLAEDREGRAVRERLRTAAGEWRRLGRAKETLWGAPQLDEFERAFIGDLVGDEASFVQRSRAALFVRRVLLVAMALAFPVSIAAVLVVTRIVRQADTDRAVADALAQARAGLGAAAAVGAASDASRTVALALFDRHRREAAEAAWTAAETDGDAMDRGYMLASRSLERALALDAERGDVRALMAETMMARALVAEHDGRLEQRDELVERFTLYDDGERAGRWSQPATVVVTSDPVGAQVVLEPDAADGHEAPHPVGRAPVVLTLPRGGYTLVLRAPGRTTVRDPIQLERGEARTLAVRLPPETDVPPGFVYVPPGRSVFGSSADDPARRGFYNTVPAHTIETQGFLIMRHEVTFGEWLAWLDRLPPGQRARHRPAVASRIGAPGSLEVTSEGGTWRLRLQPGDVATSARAGELIRFPRRSDDRGLDWLRFPVMGISAVDAEAYAAWLRSQGTVPGARLCREDEWERAARGADDRDYPHGAILRGADANFNETYGKQGMGPDEVGAHPASRSPFGIDDMSGNAFEWTLSTLDPGQYVARGGSYLQDRKMVQLAGRIVALPSLRDSTLGVRLCATATIR